MRRRKPDPLTAEYIRTLRERDKYAIPQIMQTLGIGAPAVWDALDERKGDYLRYQSRIARRARQISAGV